MKLRTEQKPDDQFKVCVVNRSGNTETFYTKTRDKAEDIFQEAHNGGYEVEIIPLKKGTK